VIISASLNATYQPWAQLFAIGLLVRLVRPAVRDATRQRIGVLPRRYMFWLEIRRSIEQSFTTKERKSKNSRLEKRWRTKYRARFFERDSEIERCGEGKEPAPQTQSRSFPFLYSTRNDCSSPEAISRLQSMQSQSINNAKPAGLKRKASDQPAKENTAERRKITRACDSCKEYPHPRKLGDYCAIHPLRIHIDANTWA
jgi:hypothetical protein